MLFRSNWIILQTTPLRGAARLYHTLNVGNAITSAMIPTINVFRKLKMF